METRSTEKHHDKVSVLEMRVFLYLAILYFPTTCIFSTAS